MTAKATSWLPLLPLAAVMAAGACGGGGCGEGTSAQVSDDESKKKSAAPAKGGGGQVDFSEFDSKPWQQHVSAKPGPSAASKRPMRPLGPPRVDWLEPVIPARWEADVLRASGPVLVMVSRADCEDCSHA